MIFTKQYLGCLSPRLLPVVVSAVAEITTLRRQVTGTQ